MKHSAPRPGGEGRFRHEALLYAGHDEFLRATASFIRDGVEAGEPTLVVVARSKIDDLHAVLGDAAAQVMFADMAGVGANPARIIPAWREFVDVHAGPGRRLRGIGEPVWAERDAITLLECQRHETLLNAAFDEGPAWWLLCPYDTSTLSAAVLAEAERSHPYVSREGVGARSATFESAGQAATLDAPLSPPSAGARAITFGWKSLRAVRALTSAEAARAGLLSARISDLVMAVNEVATNSLHHGGGTGRLRVWRERNGVVCEVSDAGQLRAPLADRRRPGADLADSRGLWLANQLCDLVQMRSSQAGTVVRLHIQGAWAASG